LLLQWLYSASSNKIICLNITIVEGIVLLWNEIWDFGVIWKRCDWKLLNLLISWIALVELCLFGACLRDALFRGNECDDPFGGGYHFIYNWLGSCFFHRMIVMFFLL
jgi:hypothetical protein